MSRTGEQRPADAAPPTGRQPAPPSSSRPPLPRSIGAAIAWALGVALLAAVAWGLLRGILELGVGLLALAAVAGWGIGAILRGAAGSPLLASAIGVAAWLGGLLATWLVSMAILQGSSRSLAERLEGTPFLDWLSPQFGILEIAALLLYVAAAAYGARRIAGANG